MTPLEIVYLTLAIFYVSSQTYCSLEHLWIAKNVKEIEANWEYQNKVLKNNYESVSSALRDYKKAVDLMREENQKLRKQLEKKT